LEYVKIKVFGYRFNNPKLTAQRSIFLFLSSVIPKGIYLTAGINVITVLETYKKEIIFHYLLFV